MSTLYIIGNGFDLHYGLHTGTADFIKYLTRERVYNEGIDAFSAFSSYAIDWNEYEEALSDLDLDKVEEQNVIAPDYSSDHEYDRDGGILNMQMYCDSLSDAIIAALEKMVDAAETEIANKENRIEHDVFVDADAIISFNYTFTIESMYNLQSVPIYHIHGYYNEADELIFGYAEPNSTYERRLDQEDEDYYINEQRKTIMRFYEGWKKNLRIKELRSFLNNMETVDTVIVYGHSMSAVDAKYMELIDQILNPNVWKVSFHGARDDMAEALRGYSFSERTELFAWRKLIANDKNQWINMESVEIIKYLKLPTPKRCEEP